jgi:hypothetical protein
MPELLVVEWKILYEVRSTNVFEIVGVGLHGIILGFPKTSSTKAPFQS